MSLRFPLYFAIIVLLTLVGLYFASPASSNTSLKFFNVQAETCITVAEVEEAVRARFPNMNTTAVSTPAAVELLANLINSLPPQTDHPADFAVIYTREGVSSAAVFLFFEGCNTVWAEVPVAMVAGLLS